MDIVIIVIEVAALVGFAAICSGLNVAFMSLNFAELRRKAKLGNPQAKAVLPLRKNTHLTLAAILLSNVAAASISPLILDSKLNGIVAVIISTLLMVVIGEITPQALFSRHALAYCARLVPVMRVMIFISYPISKPLQLMLDRLFPRERAQLQSRHELGVMIAEHVGDKNSELDDDEVEIIRGALLLSEKRVRDIMTPLRNVYWVTPDEEIDSRKIDEIKLHSWSRIPVFNKSHTTCYGLLLIKDLVDINFDEESIPIADLPLYPTEIVGSMTALDTLFRRFIIGGAHMIPVEKDDRIVGIVTIEDLLEEIVGHEIEDETDRAKRNKLKLPTIKRHKKK